MVFIFLIRKADNPDAKNFIFAGSARLIPDRSQEAIFLGPPAIFSSLFYGHTPFFKIIFPGTADEVAVFKTKRTPLHQRIHLLSMALVFTLLAHQLILRTGLHNARYQLTIPVCHEVSPTNLLVTEDNLISCEPVCDHIRKSGDDFLPVITILYLCKPFWSYSP